MDSGHEVCCLEDWRGNLYAGFEVLLQNGWVLVNRPLAIVHLLVLALEYPGQF